LCYLVLNFVHQGEEDYFQSLSCTFILHFLSQLAGHHPPHHTQWQLKNLFFSFGAIQLMVWLPIDPHFQQNPRLMFLSFYLVLNFVIKAKLVFSLFLAQKAFVSFYFFFEYFDLSLGWKKICLLILQHCCNNIILHYLKCTLQLVKNNLPLGWKFSSSLPFLISLSLECCSTQRSLSYRHFYERKGSTDKP
jgi:hypothetical protein